MPPPQFSLSHARQSPQSSHPVDPHNPQDRSDPELRRDTRGDRWSRSTSDVKKRSRSHSIPPDNRFTNDNNPQQRTSFSPVSAEDSRAWAQNPRRGSTTEVNVLAQDRGSTRARRQSVTQLMAKLDPRGRRNSVTHPPVLPPGRMSISSQVEAPVIPGVTTDVARVPNRLRRNSYRRPRILFYHKHEPHYGFTNFSAHPVMYGGRKYPTSEHLFQSLKFTHRPGLAEHIRICSPRPSVAFSEARRFAQEVRPDWNRENINAMDIVIYHKFNQHRDLKRELLATGDAELIENSDKDAFWGCGADGKGRNELGKALERLRTQLREAERR